MLGFERGSQYSNNITNMESAGSNQIRNMNAQNLSNYNVQEKMSNAINNNQEINAKARESSGFITKSREGAGEFIADARNVYKSAQGFKKAGDDIASSVSKFKRGRFIDSGLGDEGGEFMSGVSDTADVVDTTVQDSVAARRLGQTSAVATQGVSSVLESARAGLRGADAGQVVRAAARAGIEGSDIGRGVSTAFTGTRSAITGVQEGARALAGGDAEGIISGGAKVISGAKSTLGALDSLSKGAEGLNVVSGVSDILDDADGGFSKMNTKEKIGNVTGIGSAGFSLAGLAGSLEYGGTMLDATGIGAELGLAFNVAGAVLGGVSAVEDYFGSKSKQKTQPAKRTSVAKPVTIAQSNVPISALQSGGVATAGYN